MLSVEIQILNRMCIEQINIYVFVQQKKEKLNDLNMN